MSISDQSYEDVDVIEEDFVQDIYDPQVKFSETVLNLENETFKEMNLRESLQSIEKHDIQINNDKDKCTVCLQKFNFLIKQKLCHFCSNVVCERHSKKKRRDIDNIFQRICDICEEDLIQNLIMEEFMTEKDFYEKQLTEVETQCQIVISSVKLKEQEYDYIIKQLSEEQYDFMQVRNNLLNENIKNVQEIPKLIHEIDNLKDESELIDQQIQFLEQTFQIKVHHEKSKQDQYQHQLQSELLMNQYLSSQKDHILEVQSTIDTQIKREQVRLQIQSEFESSKISSSDYANSHLVSQTLSIVEKNSKALISQKVIEIKNTEDGMINEEKACDICILF